MPFSAGSYSLPGLNPVTTNTTISSTWANNTMSDIATALSTCVLKDGTQVITANIPMASFKFTGLGAGSASGNSLRYEQVNGVVTTAGDLLQATAAGAFTRVAFGTKGDLLVGSGSGVAAAVAIGAAGTVPMSRAAATSGVAYAAIAGKYIYGLTYANGTDAVNDINIAVGSAMDITGAYAMTLGTALGKQSDVNWAVGGTTGAPAGFLDTGSVGDSDYYIWLIARSDTGVVDALCSLSSTAPTMPTSYDFKRLIGWFKRVGGTVVAFHTYETEGGGIEMNWDSPTLDINLANTLTTARRTDPVKVPLNFSVIAVLNVVLNDATTRSINWIYCPDQTDLAPSATAAPLNNFDTISATVTNAQGTLKVRTSATGTIAARSNLATVDLYAVATIGFTWARRN